MSEKFTAVDMDLSEDSVDLEEATVTGIQLLNVSIMYIYACARIMHLSNTTYLQVHHYIKYMFTYMRARTHTHTHTHTHAHTRKPNIYRKIFDVKDCLLFKSRFVCCWEKYIQRSIWRIENNCSCTLKIFLIYSGMYNSHKELFTILIEWSWYLYHTYDMGSLLDCCCS